MSEEKKQWSISDIEAIYQQPFNDLLYQAHTIHRTYHDPNSLQFATLLSIKTGACQKIVAIALKVVTIKRM